MDADERLTALKKAYADIILNSAKEAAARIMVSESKAVRFQQELHVAKDEALQMLLRLKQMMDFKIHEADLTSLNQRKKIDELEAQLQEAEDIVKDLREELRVVHAELESVTNNKLQHLDERDTTLQEEISEENRLNTSHSIMFRPESQNESITACDMKNYTLNQRSESDAHIRIPYICNHDLPSIIMRSKEPELYRNGCTQRIRAFEKNLLDEGLSISEQIDDVKNEKSVRKDEEGKEICNTPAHGAENACSIEKKVVQCIKSFRKKRKRATRYNKNTKSDVTNISCLESHPNSIDSDAKSDEDPSQITPRLSLDTTETGEQLQFAEVTESEAEFVKSDSVQNTMTNDKPLLEKMVLKREDIVFVDNSGVQVEVPLGDTESKDSKPYDTTNGISSQPLNDRIIKYTFQRKRKREILSNSDCNVPLERCSLARQTEETENGSLEPQKSSSVTESSRDSRRLAQVARQLISLSEKKWWQ